MSAMDLRCRDCGAPAFAPEGRVKRTCDCPADTPVIAHMHAVVTGKAAVAGEAPG